VGLVGMGVGGGKEAGRSHRLLAVVVIHGSARFGGAGSTGSGGIGKVYCVLAG